MNKNLKDLCNSRDLISDDDIKQYNRFQRILRTTKDRRVYSLLYKKLLALNKVINCNFCAYHDNENGHKKQRSWKKYRPNQCKDVKFRRVNYGYKAVTKKRVESI